MKTKLEICMFLAIITTLFSCKDNISSKNSNESINMKIFLSEWETTTYNRIESTIMQDLSDSVLYYRRDMTLCNGDTYFIERCIAPRNNLMNSVLPILLNEYDSVLVVEEQSFFSYFDLIKIYCGEYCYIYKINQENRQISFCKMESINFAEELSFVVIGYYYCGDEKLTEINDLTCITLITKQREKINHKILALTINVILANDNFEYPQCN